MELVSVSRDRHSAHVELATIISGKGNDRNFKWRMIREGALVRRDDEEILVPETGNTVTFSIEAIPLTRCRGKRTYLYTRNDRTAFITGSLYANAGLLVDPQLLTIEDTIGFIVRNSDDRFVKPSAQFSGTAEVIDSVKLEAALRHGVGQGKAYGYGLLIVTEE